MGNTKQYLSGFIRGYPSENIEIGHETDTSITKEMRISVIGIWISFIKMMRWRPSWSELHCNALTTHIDKSLEKTHWIVNRVCLIKPTPDAAAATAVDKPIRSSYHINRIFLF